MPQEGIANLISIIRMPELRCDTLTVVGKKVSGVVDRFSTAHDLYMEGDSTTQITPSLPGIITRSGLLNICVKKRIVARLVT